MHHVGPGQWRILHEDGQGYRIQLAFDQTSHSVIEENALTDLNPTTGSGIPLKHGTTDLSEFLTQFEEVEYRRPHYWEPGTYHLIVQCAKYQREILAHKPPASASAFDENTLIAQLLRCFLISHEIADVNGNYTPLGFMEDDSEVTVITDEGFDDYWGLEPAITVRIDDTSSSGERKRHRDAKGHNHAFPAILKKAIANLQRLIFRRQPQDIPCLIYSLCLLALTVSALTTTHAPFLIPVKVAGDELDDIFRTLCDLYLFSLGHVHPLRDEVDMVAYVSLVDNDPVPVKHFDALNRLWQQFGE